MKIKEKRKAKKSWKKEKSKEKTIITWSEEGFVFSSSLIKVKPPSFLILILTKFLAFVIFPLFTKVSSIFALKSFVIGGNVCMQRNSQVNKTKDKENIVTKYFFDISSGYNNL